MDDLKDTLSKNLVTLRQKAKLTQAQLAEMLNYSDKAVSKWERGESIPDLHVLVQLSKIYGVSLDELVTNRDVAKISQPRRRLTTRRLVIALISAIFVWFVAAVIFIVFYFVDPSQQYAWMVFIVAPLPMSIVLTVFSVRWGNRITHTIFSSMILWSIMLVINVFVYEFAREFTQIYWLYLPWGVFQALIVLWFLYRWYSNRVQTSVNKYKRAKKKEEEKEERAEENGL